MTAAAALMRRSCPAGWLFAPGSNAPSLRTSDEAGRAGARDQQQPKSQAALATIEQTQHVRSSCGFSFVPGSMHHLVGFRVRISVLFRFYFRGISWACGGFAFVYVV